MNRVRVIIESDSLIEGEGNRRTDIQSVFPEPDFQLEDVLGVVEDALRGHGFHCPYEHLTVVDDEE